MDLIKESIRLDPELYTPCDAEKKDSKRGVCLKVLAVKYKCCLIYALILVLLMQFIYLIVKDVIQSPHMFAILANISRVLNNRDKITKDES